MKVCILTTHHKYNDARIYHKEAKSLAKNGHDVTLIAPGSNNRKKDEDGIKIIITKRAFNEIFHIITLLRVLLEGKRNKADVYHCHEIGSLIIGVFLKYINKSKLVYDVHEHHPSYLTSKPRLPNIIKPPIYRLTDKLELYFCKFTDHIVTVSQILSERFEKIKPTTILYNVPPIDLIQLYTGNKNKTIVYTGGVNKKRGFDKLLKSISKIKDVHENILLVVPGHISDTKQNKKEMIDYIKTNDLEKNINITGWLEYKEVMNYVQEANAGLILFQPTHYNNIIGLPNKLFEYMGCGIPVIASNFSQIREIIEEAMCGILVNPTDVDDITKAIRYIIENPEIANNMGQRGYKAVKDKYNWENMEKRLCYIYEELE